MKTRLFYILLLVSSISLAQIPTDYVARYDFTNGDKTNLANPGTGDLRGTITNSQLTSNRFSNPKNAIKINRRVYSGYTFTGVNNNVSISFWIKGGRKNYRARIFQFFDGSGNGFDMHTNNNRLEARFKVQRTTYWPAVNKRAIYDGNWHHIVFNIKKTNSGYSNSIYIDGVKETTLSNGISPRNKGNFLTSNAVLAISPLSNYVNEMDDIRIYNRALSVQEVTNLFKEGSNLTRYYVNANVSAGTQNGDSWANASSNLQAVLNAAGSSTSEIWIAKGIYKPGTARTNKFVLNKKNLNIYGGFSGTETNLSDRDISKIHTDNATILSGDLKGNDDKNITFNNTTKGDNSYRVVNVIANNITINGLTIANGYADAVSGERRFGAGIRVNDNVVNFTIKNSVIKNNTAYWGSGIIYAPNATSSFTIDACIFENNLASSSGAAFYTFAKGGTTTIRVTNSLFKNNKTANDTAKRRKALGSAAGWIRAYNSRTIVNAIVVNNTFVNNVNQGTGANSDFPTIGISRRTGTLTATIANNIFWGNTKNGNTTALAIGKVRDNLPALTVSNSIDENNFSNIATRNITNSSNTNPNLTTDFKLQASSTVAINTGDNSKIPSGITKDLAGNDRIINTTVDMGAYEYKANTCNNIVNIPNANFKAALLAHGVSIKGRGISKIDTNNDGVICTDEAQAYTGKIHIYNKSINDLTGIEAFTSITELLCNNNQLTSLDVTKNTRLQRLYCSNNRLTNLDVTKNTSLMYLYCNNNRLTNLDVTKNTSLRYLYCNNNQLTSLNLTKNTSLQRLYCSNNQLTSLNVTKNTILQGLYCYNNKLTNVDITKNTRLRYLYCNNNKLTNVDITKNTHLRRLYCHNNQLTNLDVTKNISLQRLDCFNNQLANIDVTKNTRLRYLNCHSNQLTSLNVTKNTSLQRLYCNNNQLTSLNIANGNNGASSSKLRYVTATNNPNLTCIQHDTGFDPTTNRNWRKDTTANWSTNCASASINDEVYNNSISMYPNPVRTTLNISSKNVAIEKVAVYNLLGKKVMESTQTNINVNNLNSGVYILKVQSRDNKIAVKKFIKE